MKLKDLISKLQALNPEAEVYVYGPDDDLVRVCDVRRAVESSSGRYEIRATSLDATPSDTLIVLSE